MATKKPRTFHAGVVPCYHCKSASLEPIHHCMGDGSLEVTVLLLHCSNCGRPSEMIFGMPDDGGFTVTYRDALHFLECHADLFDNAKTTH